MLMGDRGGSISMLVAVCVCCCWGVVWCSDPDRAVWEHQGMEGGWEEGVQQHVKPGNRCLFTTGETVPTQNNERALPLLNKKKKKHFCFLVPLKGHGVRDRESTQKPPVCRQSGLAQYSAKAEVIINRAVPS